MNDVVEQQPSRQELADALDFRDRVLGILGHDLRNPLSAISALTTLTMERQDLPAGVRERLVQVDRAARRSLDLIETLLDFSESRGKGVLTTHPVVVDPVELVMRALDELRAAHPGRLITLTVGQRGLGELDPVRMEQLLSNLVANALVHGAPDAPVEVSVDVCDGETIVVVRNRGPVIPHDALPRLFQPFTQGLSRGGDRPRGLGLGLYIVQNIVSAHGGTVSVESDLEHGTSFVVRLPRLRAA